jgi:Family of unknown function (DUF5906)
MTSMLVLTASPKKPITKTVVQKVDALTGEISYVIQQYDTNIKYFSSKDWPVNNFEDLARSLQVLMGEHSSCVIRGQIKDGVDREHHERRKAQGDGGCIEDVDQQWVALDVDDFPLAALGTNNIYEAPALLKKMLPTCFADASCFWKFSSSTGFKSKGTVSVHFWFWLSAPASNRELKEYFEVFNKSFKDLYGVEKNFVDTVFFDSAQIHYTAAPVLIGFKDPIKNRCGIIPGADAVHLTDDTEPSGSVEEVEKTVHAKLKMVGADKKGFHGPLLSASMIAARVWPGVNGLNQFKALAREAIAAAEKGVHTKEQIDRYVSDHFLDNLFNTASRKIEEGPGANTSPEIQTLIRRYIFVKSMNKYYDTRSGFDLVEESLNKSAMKYTNGKKIASTIFHSGIGQQVESLVFRPDFPSKTKFTEKGADYYNTWEGRIGEVLAEPPVIEPLINHVDFLCDGREEEREQLLDFMAYIIANPGKKIRWAPVISGQEGTGKSTLKHILRRVYRKMSIREISVADLESQFNDYAESELIFLEEVYASNKMGMSDKLKALITEDTLNINKKFVQAKNTPNFINLMIFTNQQTPLYMSDSDRRYLMIRSNNPKKEQDYYDRLYQWIEHEKTSDWLTTWAHTRDLSKFSPTKPPVMTMAKMKVISNSRPAAEQLLEQAKRERVWPLQHDVVPFTKFSASFNEKFKASSGKFREWLEAVGIRIELIEDREMIIMDRAGRTDEELLKLADAVVVGSERDYYSSGHM